MKREVLLTIVSNQQMPGEAPETTRLVTDGLLEEDGEAIVLSYAESELTGLQGTTTSFRILPEEILLTRSGALNSQMCFHLHTEHQSLYDMGFGALLLRIRTDHLSSNLTPEGGTLEVSYTITIEDQASGRVSYRLTARPK